MIKALVVFLSVLLASPALADDYANKYLLIGKYMVSGLGTIRASILSPDVFRMAMIKEDRHCPLKPRRGRHEYEKCTWMPADGSVVPDKSSYAKVMRIVTNQQGEIRLPDLRGVHLKGAETFDTMLTPAGNREPGKVAEGDSGSKNVPIYYYIRIN